MIFFYFCFLKLEKGRAMEDKKREIDELITKLNDMIIKGEPSNEIANLIQRLEKLLKEYLGK